MIFIYLPLAAVPRLIEPPSHAAEISSQPVDDILPSGFQFQSRDTPDATAKSRDPIFGHSAAVSCGAVLAAFVGLAILGCLIANRRTLCYKRRGMFVRCWKNLCRKKTKDTERAEPDPDPGPYPEAAALVQYQRGFFSICMGSQMQDQRITTDNHPVRVIAVAAPSTTRSLPKSLSTTSSPLPSSSSQGCTSKTTKTTVLPTAMTAPSRGLPRTLRPLIRPSALWPPPAPGYSTYPSSKPRYSLNTDDTTRVITATRPRRPSPHTILPTAVVVQASSKSVFSSDSRWIGRLFRERRASADGTHISNYFSQTSPNPHTSPSESPKPMAAVAEKMGCSGQGGGSGFGGGRTASATTPQETATDLTRRMRRPGCRHKVMRARQ